MDAHKRKEIKKKKNNRKKSFAAAHLHAVLLYRAALRPEPVTTYNTRLPCVFCTLPKGVIPDVPDNAVFSLLSRAKFSRFRRRAKLKLENQSVSAFGTASNRCRRRARADGGRRRCIYETFTTLPRSGTFWRNVTGTVRCLREPSYFVYPIGVRRQTIIPSTLRSRNKSVFIFDNVNYFIKRLKYKIAQHCRTINFQTERYFTDS